MIKEAHSHAREGHSGEYRLTHLVKRGESLWSIAKSELGDPLAWPQIAEKNSLRKPFKILIGQRLAMPGRTPAAIAYNFGPVCSFNSAQAHDRATVMPARAYIFVVVQEVLPNAKLVRKVIPIPEVDVPSMVVNRPDLFGFHPRDSKATTSLGEHALGNTLSKYISASDKPGGAPNFDGLSWYIDLAKIRKAGVPVHSTGEIIKDLDRIAKLDPRLTARIATLKSVIKKVEGEVLLEGKVPKGAVQTAEAAARELKTLSVLSRGAKVLGVIGVIFTVYDLGSAGSQSVQQHSIRPISAEAIRQIGGWGGAWVGMKIGFAGGAALGIETGPGALLTGLGGGMIFGFIGYWAGDKLADTISPN